MRAADLAAAFDRPRQRMRVLSRTALRVWPGFADSTQLLFLCTGSGRLREGLPEKAAETGADASGAADAPPAPASASERGADGEAPAPVAAAACLANDCGETDYSEASPLSPAPPLAAHALWPLSCPSLWEVTWLWSQFRLRRTDQALRFSPLSPSVRHLPRVAAGTRPGALARSPPSARRRLRCEGSDLPQTASRSEDVNTTRCAAGGLRPQLRPPVPQRVPPARDCVQLVRVPTGARLGRLAAGSADCTVARRWPPRLVARRCDRGPCPPRSRSAARRSFRRTCSTSRRCSRGRAPATATGTRCSRCGAAPLL